VIYRVLEKITSVRLETPILNFLFMLFGAVKFFQIGPVKKETVVDKRSMWESVRFQSADELASLNTHLQNCRKYGVLSYENSMELSIRGINLILAKYESKPSDLKGFRTYLFLAYVCTFICPDMYVRRDGFRFYDESNNHYFYNLLYRCLFEIIFFGRFLSHARLRRFLVLRLDSDGFYNEGASFYHFGVVHSLLTLRKFLGQHVPLSASVFESIFDFNRPPDLLDLLGKVNFGDRDGTLIGKFDTGLYYTVPPNDKNTGQRTDSFSIISNERLVLCIRTSCSVPLGTGGHIHDDFGHVSIFTNSLEPVLVDPGIYLYSEEPKFCKAKFHNFPVIEGDETIKFIARFERKILHQYTTQHSRGTTTLKSVSRSGTRYRVIDCKDFSFADYSKVKGVIKSRFLFALEDTSLIRLERCTTHTDVFVGDITGNMLRVFGEADIRAVESEYFPEYGVRKACSSLLIRWNVQSLEKTKLLEWKAN